MAGFKEMLEAQKPIKIQLSKELELDEVYSMMNSKASQFKNEFELKKSLLGKRIQFKKDAETDLIVTVTVKSDTVIVKPVIQENKTTVGVGNVDFRVDKNSMLNKGISGVANIPLQRAEYLKNIAETIKNILAM